jgi:hypothetical protein
MSLFTTQCCILKGMSEALKQSGKLCRNIQLARRIKPQADCGLLMQFREGAWDPAKVDFLPEFQPSTSHDMRTPVYESVQ